MKDANKLYAIKEKGDRQAFARVGAGFELAVI